MTAELWQKVCRALDELLPLPAGRREAELRRLRQAEPEVAAEVEGLLRQQDTPRDLGLESAVCGAWGTVQDLAPADELPTQIGPSRVQGEVGQGGMGVVYRARDRLFRRSLALKVLAERHRGQADLKRRFLEEAQLMGQLQHPGIPPVHDLGELPDGRPYFAMKRRGPRPGRQWGRRRTWPRSRPAARRLCSTSAATCSGWGRSCARS